MIKTENLKLVLCTTADAEAFEKGESEFAARLNVSSIDPGWNVFPETMPFAFKYAAEQADQWGMYYFIHRADNILIGNGGFRGAPNDDAAVEIGYALSEKYRGRGLATEAAQGLIHFAFSFPSINIVQAHTLAEENASNKILQKIGMKFVRAVHDAEDGDIWLWQLPRQEYIKQF